MVERCDRYETAWRKGRRPRIEDYLAEALEPERAALSLASCWLWSWSSKERWRATRAAGVPQAVPGHVELINRILNEAGPSTPHDQQAPTGSDQIGWEPSPTEELFAQTFEKEIGKADWPEVAGYDILAELGQGGMGVVDKARQQQLERLVALKMLRAELHAGPKDLNRFRLEGRRSPGCITPISWRSTSRREGRPPLRGAGTGGGGQPRRRLNGTPQPARQAAEVMVTLARAMHTRTSRHPAPRPQTMQRFVRPGGHSQDRRLRPG